MQNVWKILLSYADFRGNPPRYRISLLAKNVYAWIGTVKIVPPSLSG